MPKFLHHPLRLLNPSFDSPLIDVLTDLDHVRRLRIEGDTPVAIFVQLKRVFHMLESLGSARIEGNHTTLVDYVETKVDGATPEPSDQIREITNIEKAMDYIDRVVEAGADITEHFIRELHQMTVNDLVREGDETPGAYRSRNVQIALADHTPPDHVTVRGYMEELVEFINAKDPPKYDLMKVALAHHRFGWIHPFHNGNGRVVRLLTYALLAKYGFNVTAGVNLGRVLNPSAVFCNDRAKYYERLSVADQGDAKSLEEWCIYVLQGMLDEIRKIDRLTDFTYLKDKILGPAVRVAGEREWLTKNEVAVLMFAMNSATKTLKAGDLQKIIPGLNTQQRTYQINKLLQSGMLQPISPGARQYTIGFASSYLMRGIIPCLMNEGFIPDSLGRN